MIDLTFGRKQQGDHHPWKLHRQFKAVQATEQHILVYPAHLED